MIKQSIFLVLLALHFFISTSRSAISESSNSPNSNGGFTRTDNESSIRNTSFPNITNCTESAGILCLKVVPGVTWLAVSASPDLEECRPGPEESYSFKVNNSAGVSVGANTCMTFPCNITRLTPNNEYELTPIFCTNDTTAWTEEVRTLQPGATPPVTHLEIYKTDPDTNSISIRWRSPPVNGEIESYQVSIIGEYGQILQNKTVKVLGEALDCNKTETYICLRSFALLPHAVVNSTRIEVYAKNKNVEQSGERSTIRLDPDSHFNVSSRPLGLTATSEDRGIVTLEWEHPEFCYQKIVQFVIEVELLGTKLRENIDTQFPINKTLLVTNKQKNYTEKLYLRTSSSYRTSVMAVNINNSTSSRAQVNISVTGGVAFASDDNFQVTQNGTAINLEVPKVINATESTMIRVSVKGSMDCVEKQAERQILLSNMTEWIAAEYQSEVNRSKYLTIDYKRSQNVTRVCALKLGETYEIEVSIEDPNSGASAIPISSRITLIANEESEKPNLTWIIILPISVICLLLIVSIYWYRNPHRIPKQLRASSYRRLTPLSSTQTSTTNLSIFFYNSGGSNSQPRSEENRSHSDI